MATIKSIEEKAKAYDKALEKARQLCVYPTSKPFTSDLQDLFPELAETEDERIRKLIIKHFKEIANSNEQSWISLDIPYILAWLEKQGEHANFRNKIKIGDKVTRNEDGVLVNLSQLKRVAKKDEKQGEQKPLGFNIGDEITVNGQICKVVAVEQKPADKVEHKFKVGNIIRLKGTVVEYTIRRVTDTTYYTDGWSCGIERCEEDYELVEQTPTWGEEDENFHTSQGNKK